MVVSDSAEDDDEEMDEENMMNCSNQVGSGGPHPCVVCKAALEHHGQSRPLPKHQASQYGLLVSILYFHSSMMTEMIGLYYESCNRFLSFLVANVIYVRKLMMVVIGLFNNMK